MLVITARGGWPRRLDLLALVACAAAYLVCSAPSRPCCGSPAALPLMFGAIGFPFAFWRLARVVLEDDRSIPQAAWAGLAMLLMSGVPAAADYLDFSTAWRMAFGVVNKIMAFGFVGAALLAAWRSWDGDLVEQRRALRWVLMGYLGVYALAVLVAEVYLLGRQAPAWLDALNVAMIGLTLLASLLFLVQVRPQAAQVLFDPAEPKPEQAPLPAAADSDEPLLQRLYALMDEEKLYRDQELTVRGFAARMGVPEYVLRRLIHDRLGYRNFAAFVNEYRLREVSRRLADPTLDRRPILTLALEAGFGSIGPFNRIFRDRYALTPSEFRSRRAESPAASPAATDTAA
jgi:AraC-like DNA-binding protein